MMDDISEGMASAFSAGQRLGEQILHDRAIDEWERYAEDLARQLAYSNGENAILRKHAAENKALMASHAESKQKLVADYNVLVDKYNAQLAASRRLQSDVATLQGGNDQLLADRKTTLAAHAQLKQRLAQQNSDSGQREARLQSSVDDWRKLAGKGADLVKLLHTRAHPGTIALHFDESQTREIKALARQIVSGNNVRNALPTKDQWRHFPCQRLKMSMAAPRNKHRRGMTYWCQLRKAQRLSLSGGAPGWRVWPSTYSAEA